MNWNPRENKALRLTIMITAILIVIAVFTLAAIYDWPGFGGGGYHGP